MHRDNSLRAKLLTAEALDTLLFVDLCVFVADGNRAGGADFLHSEQAGSDPRDAGAAGEHAGRIVEIVSFFVPRTSHRAWA